jgi:hypothetical protein
MAKKGTKRGKSDDDGATSVAGALSVPVVVVSITD